jgi:hydroxypyruvate reductase
MIIVRKHLSRIKGGRLARAGRRAGRDRVTLAIIRRCRMTIRLRSHRGNPTVPDPSTLGGDRPRAGGES